MHSSRMCTIRYSSHLLPGGCLPTKGVVCLPVEGGGVSAWWDVCLPGEGGVCPGGCLPAMGCLPARGACLLGGICLLGKGVSAPSPREQNDTFDTSLIKMDEGHEGHSNLTLRSPFSGSQMTTETIPVLLPSYINTPPRVQCLNDKPP